MKVNRGYLAVPISLVSWALQSNKSNHLGLYVCFKLLALKSGGYLFLNEVSYKDLGDALCVTPKSIKKYWDWLIENKWITVNEKRKVFRIISYDKVIYKLSIKKKEKGKYDVLINNSINFKALWCGVLTSYFLRQKRYYERTAKPEIVSFIKTKCPKGFYPMSLEYIAKNLKVSISTACRYLKLAKEHGYVDVIENLIDIGIENKSFYFVQKQYAEMDLRSFIRRGKEGSIVKIGPNLIRSNFI